VWQNQTRQINETASAAGGEDIHLFQTRRSDFNILKTCTDLYQKTLLKLVLIKQKP